MFCSPYFVVGSLVLLLIVTMKYFSLSSENDNLQVKINVLQNQLKMTATNVRNLDKTLAKRDEAYSECQTDQGYLNERIKMADKEVADMKDEQASIREELESLQKINERLVTSNKTIREELSYLRNQNEELKRAEEECKGYQVKIAEMQGELNTIKETVVPSHISMGREHLLGVRQAMPNGELPDVNPGAVHIRQAALQGNTYHTDKEGQYVPILPRGDAEKPRPQAQLSVMNMVDTSSSKKNKTQEEVVKNSQEVKKDYEEFTTSKAESREEEGEQTEKFADVKKALDTAVLSKPLDLSKLNLDAKEAENDRPLQAVDNEVADDQDPNGLEDPAAALEKDAAAANDQDYDDRVFDDIKDDFRKRLMGN